ncbi:MAG: hypothetical protein WC273_07610, partial [Dehalococcoidia bacterium]
MTTPANATFSMRFSPDELLAGMLATLDSGDFPADEATLRTVFSKIAAEFPLLAPFGTSDDAVSRAISVLEARDLLVHEGDRYKLTAEG